MSIFQRQAAAELLRRRRARVDPVHYAEYVEVPGRPVEEEAEEGEVVIDAPETLLAAHHKMILREVEACFLKNTGRLMIFMPPGSAKSTYGSVVAPSYLMGKYPKTRIGLASYADSLALKMGRRTRSIINQKRYTKTFDTEMSNESAAANNFKLTNGSEYMATGILGAFTGNRFECLRGDTLVHTENGLVAISELYDVSFSGKVLSYEKHSRKLVYRSVQAVARSEKSCFYRVHTAAGSVVEATGDHRFWTGRGWVETHLLAAGDILMQVLPRERDAPRVLPAQEHSEWGRRPVLRRTVRAKAFEPVARNAREIVQALRRGRSAEGARVLLGPMSVGHARKAESIVSVRRPGPYVRGVQQGVPTAQPVDARALLLPSMQGPRARNANARRGQPIMAKRGEPRQIAAAFGESVSEGSPAYRRAGRGKMRSLRFARFAARAPYRHGRVKQSLGQSRNPVRTLSSEVARGGAFKTKADSVVLVERVCESTEVYDIQVEGTHCFFANGILVHNCLIIDDPVKGREQADSETIREKTYDAYKDDLLTRLVPGGSIVIIQTRWHEDDLAGRILPEDWNGESGDIVCRDGNTWRVLCLQAECDTDSDPLGRARGEMLWKEWFTPQHWAQFRGEARTWGALFQQIPKPKDGLMFNPGKIEIVDALPAGRITWVRGWDLAATEGGGAYTVGALLGIHQESQRPVIAHIERFQHAPGRRDERMRNVGMLDGRGIKQDIPDDPGAGGTAVVEYITKKLKGLPVVSSSESGDKETRAQPFASEVNIGNVMMVRGDWNRPLLDEMRAFPNGTYKDQVDALSRAYTRLVPLPGKMSINKQLLQRVRR